MRAKEALYEQLRGGGSRWLDLKVACDLWTAAFFVAKAPGRMEVVATTAQVRAHLARPGTSYQPLVGVAGGTAEVNRFFHWPLEFPDVFAAGGFDVVLGNPPWERVKLQEQEFFAGRDHEIATAANKAARDRLIRTLPQRRPELAAEFEDAQHAAEAQSQFLRTGGRFPLCGRGDINTYAVFAELMRRAVGPAGRTGIIVPTGIATDDTTTAFFGDIVRRTSLVSLLSFENEAFLFPAIHHAMKFCLLTLAGTDGTQNSPSLVFFARSVEQAQDARRRFTLLASDFSLLNPNTLTCPVFRTSRDADITRGIYRRVPVLIKHGPPEANPWGVRFGTLFHMSNDSHLFRYRKDLEADGWRLDGNVFVPPGAAGRFLPLYEAKMLHQFNHRFGDYAMKRADSHDTQLPDVPLVNVQDPGFAPESRYWVAEAEVEAKLAGKWDDGWLLGWRDITNATNERTVIASLVPTVAVGNKLPLMLLSNESALAVASLVANLGAFVLDYAARQKLGGTTLNFFIYKQLPVLPPHAHEQSAPWADVTVGGWVRRRVLELTYTAHDLAPFARDLGYDGPPFTGTRNAASPSAANSTPPSSTFTASPARTWTTSWTPSPSSGARTKRPTASTARNAPSSNATTTSPAPSPPASPTSRPSTHPPATPAPPTRPRMSVDGTRCRGSARGKGQVCPRSSTSVRRWLPTDIADSTMGSTRS